MFYFSHVVVEERLAIDFFSAFYDLAPTVGDSGNAAAVPASLTAELNRRDQWATAASHDPDDKMTLPTCYNSARNLIPAGTLTPCVPYLAKRHTIPGVTRKRGRHWQLESALEYHIRRFEIALIPNFQTANPVALSGQVLAAHTTY